MYKQNRVTMIQDLPEMDDLEAVGNGNNPPSSYGGNGGNRGNHVENYDSPQQGLNIQKFLRPNQKLSPDSGMIPYGAPPQQASMDSDDNFTDQPQMQPRNPALDYNCIDIANHIQNCPICSRFYNTDKTLYIITIVILAVICLLLIKRVLNV